MPSDAVGVVRRGGVYCQLHSEPHVLQYTAAPIRTEGMQAHIQTPHPFIHLLTRTHTRSLTTYPFTHSKQKQSLLATTRVTRTWQARTPVH